MSVNRDMHTGGVIIGEHSESCEKSSNIICLITMIAMKGVILYVLLA